MLKQSPLTQIEKDGSYTAPASPKIAYGSMVHLRAMIVGGCAKTLSIACTIATRYSAVRRQSELKPG